MKDQKTLDEDLTPLDKWDRAKTLMLESLYKPDNALRNCSINQHCKDELMEIRDQVIDIVREMQNPYTPPLEFGKKNNHVEPTIKTPQGNISETLMSGALGAYYMSDQREY
tara:strand:- start:124 stop:456 length:333 start_codon:yes stop_codon:yes gene_type:complete